MKFSKILLLVWLACLASVVPAQKTWDKPFQKWSKDEAIKILSDSPWAQTYQSEASSALAAQQQSAREQSDQRILGRADSGRVERSLGVQPVIIRLNSALPIRQALARLQQIAAGYDKMNEEQRSKVDASTKEFLECKICQSFYVVTITKFVKAAGQGVDDGMFQSTKFEELKGNVKLVNDKGEQRELTQFIAAKRPGESSVLLFTRNDNKGVSLITPQSKEFSLVFSSAILSKSQNPYAGLLPRRLDFKVSKMIVGNNAEF